MGSETPNEEQKHNEMTMKRGMALRAGLMAISYALDTLAGRFKAMQPMEHVCLGISKVYIMIDDMLLGSNLEAFMEFCFSNEGFTDGHVFEKAEMLLEKQFIDEEGEIIPEGYLDATTIQ